MKLLGDIASTSAFKPIMLVSVDYFGSVRLSNFILAIVWMLFVTHIWLLLLSLCGRPTVDCNRYEFWCIL